MRSTWPASVSCIAGKQCLPLAPGRQSRCDSKDTARCRSRSRSGSCVRSECRVFGATAMRTPCGARRRRGLPSTASRSPPVSRSPQMLAASIAPAGTGHCISSVPLSRQFNLGATRGRLGVFRKPYPEDLFSVAQGAGNQLEPAIRVVFPPDTHFFDTIATPLCQIKNFYVEHVSINLLTTKKIVSYLPAKELETALCVMNVPQTDQTVHDKRESPRTQLSMKRLRNLDEGASHSTGTDHNVVPVIELRQKFFQFLYRSLIISIDETDNLTLRQSYGLSDSAPFPSPLGCSQDTDPRIFGRQLAGSLARAIVAIGGYQNLVRVSSGRTIALDRLKCPSYDMNFVISWNNHTEEWRNPHLFSPGRRSIT